jgi:hypothetical protein
MLTAATRGEEREQMTETGTEFDAQLAAVPEGTRDSFLDLLLEHWPRIAAVAWVVQPGGEALPAASSGATVH